MIVETVFSFTPVDNADKSVGAAIPLVVSAALALVMLYRASEIRHANDVRDPGPKATVLAANVIAALAAGSFLTARHLPGWLDGLGLNPAFRLNPMLVVVVASTLAAYGLAVIILGPMRKFASTA